MNSEMIATHQILKISTNGEEIKGEVQSKKWSDEMILAVKGAGVLDLIRHIKERITEIERSEITMSTTKK